MSSSQDDDYDDLRDDWKIIREVERLYEAFAFPLPQTIVSLEDQTDLAAALFLDPAAFASLPPALHTNRRWVDLIRPEAKLGNTTRLSSRPAMIPDVEIMTMVVLTAGWAQVDYTRRLSRGMECKFPAETMDARLITFGEKFLHLESTGLLPARNPWALFCALAACPWQGVCAIDPAGMLRYIIVGSAKLAWLCSELCDTQPTVIFAHWPVHVVLVRNLLTLLGIQHAVCSSQDVPDLTRRRALFLDLIPPRLMLERARQVRARVVKWCVLDDSPDMPVFKKELYAFSASLGLPKKDQAEMARFLLGMGELQV